MSLARAVVLVLIQAELNTRTASLAAKQAELSAPVQIHTGGEPIDIKRVGHSAPFVGDIDGDGRLDLLTGDAGESFVAPPDQSDEEKAAVEQARKNVPDLLKKWSQALQCYRSLENPVEGEDSAARQEREKKASESLDTVNTLKREIAAAQATINAAQPQRQLHGRGWLFLRRSP